MQKNPTSQQVQVVLDNFAKVLPIANGHEDLLDMTEGHVIKTSKIRRASETECGTPMCHGGWYAVAVLEKLQENYGEKIIVFDEIEAIHVRKEGKQFAFIDYNEGAEQMAKDLGFDDKIDLMNWADENNEIWGNYCGSDIFSSSAAFKDPDTGVRAKSLNDIVKHWERVRDRLIALEAQPKEEVANGN